MNKIKLFLTKFIPIKKVRHRISARLKAHRVLYDFLPQRKICLVKLVYIHIVITHCLLHHQIL